MLLTFATTGENPNASRVGKVISEPDPTMVLIVPATRPTPTMARASSTDMERVYRSGRGGSTAGAARARCSAVHHRVDPRETTGVPPATMTGDARRARTRRRPGIGAERAPGATSSCATSSRTTTSTAPASCAAAPAGSRRRRRRSPRPGSVGSAGRARGYGPPAFASPPSPYANYGARVVAWLIDWVITSVIGSIALLPLHAVHQVSSSVGRQLPTATARSASPSRTRVLFCSSSSSSSTRPLSPVRREDRPSG